MTSSQTPGMRSMLSQEISSNTRLKLPEFEIQLKIKQNKFFDFFGELDKLLLGHVRWICILSKLSIGLHQCQNSIDFKKTITLKPEVLFCRSFFCRPLFPLKDLRNYSTLFRLFLFYTNNNKMIPHSNYSEPPPPCFFPSPLSIVCNDRSLRITLQFFYLETRELLMSCSCSSGIRRARSQVIRKSEKNVFVYLRKCFS